MGAISNLFDRRATKVTGSHPSSPDYWVQKLMGGGSATDAGINIDHNNALTYTPFWAAVNIIAGAVGSLPLVTYRRLKPRGKQRAPSHPAYKLLHDRVNDFISAQIFRETLMAHTLTYGNGYAEIERNGTGKPINLWPLLPNRVVPKVGIKDGKDWLWYEVTLKDGSKKPLPYFNVLHIPGLGFDGLKGYSVVEFHKNALGLGMAVKKFGSKFFANGARPGGVLEHPKKLDDKGFNRLRKQWNEVHEGLDNTERFAILEEDMKWHETSTDPTSAQALETQKFSVTDVARMFQIPPHMLAEMDRATFNNIENQGIMFLTMTLYRWLRKWENECNYKLFGEETRGHVFCEFLTAAFLRGDTKKRYDAYHKGRQGGWLSVNDIRDMENQNPIEGGDVYLSPLNMKPAGQDGDDDDSQDEDKDAKDGQVDEKNSRSIVRVERIAESFTPLLGDAISRLHKKELNDAGRARDKNPDAFDKWVQQYYTPSGNFAENFLSAIAPTIEAVSETLWMTITAEIIPPEMRTKVIGFAADVTERYLARSRGLHAGTDRALDVKDFARREIERLSELLNQNVQEQVNV